MKHRDVTNPNAGRVYRSSSEANCLTPPFRILMSADGPSLSSPAETATQSSRGIPFGILAMAAGVMLVLIVVFAYSFSKNVQAVQGNSADHRLEELSRIRYPNAHLNQ